jgi:hypothetical protein
LTLETIPSLDWVFATTYADGAPHEYVSDRTDGMSQADFVRAARVIRTFGHPQKFYRSTRTCLEDDAGWKYWDMEGDDLALCNLINRGRVNHVYGVQNAPSTRSESATPYDELATFWDAGQWTDELETNELVRIMASLSDYAERRVLDIGCGTGRALDLRFAVPPRYVGIDPSSAMLNELVRKHKTPAGIHPTTLEGAFRQRVLGGTRFDLVLALGGAASYLAPSDIHCVSNYARGPIVLSFYAEGEQPPTLDLPVGTENARNAARLVARFVDVAGRFEIITIDGTE